MKFSYKYYYILLPTILMVTLLEHKILMVAARRKQSDSILEIMNTREIEHMLTERERRLNSSISSSNSRDDGNQFIIQNDLDEDFIESLSRSDRYHHQHRRQQQQHHQSHEQQQQQQQQSSSSEIGIDFEYPGINNGNNNNNNNNGNRKRNRENHNRENSDVLMPYNDTLFPTPNSSSNGQTSYPPSESMASVAASATTTGGLDLQDMKSDKILKSSKNALYITRKEYLKKDWCKTEPLVQRIREPGCLTRTFINRFCYGQCNSFYIPKSPKRKRNNINNSQQQQQPTTMLSRYIEQDHFEDEDLTPAAFRSCGFCKPKKFTWITVTLRCPSLVPQLRKKRVQRIKQCRCMAEPLD